MSQFLWHLNKTIEIQCELKESVIKISNIENHLYVQTAKNHLYHGLVQNSTIKLIQDTAWKIIDLDADAHNLFLVNLEGTVFRCTKDLEIINEISLLEEYECSRGHTGTKCRMNVAKIAASDFGVLFVTNCGSLWAMGKMPQIGVTSVAAPRKVSFFNGRYIHSINVGSDFAIAIVSKPIRQDFDDDDDGDDEIFITDCPQCSALTSPASHNSLADLKIKGSYDIETTSTTSSLSLDREQNELDDEEKEEKRNIIFRNTEAAKEFLTRQISRMSSVGEEYLVECTEKPTRLLKENVASFVKTVGDKVITLSRHVSGSSDCNSVLELPKDETVGSASQCASEKDISEETNVSAIIKEGVTLINSEVWTWGNIVHGQLGIGDKIRRERPMIITKLSNIGVRKVAVRKHHAAVLTLDGRAFTWGRNNHNQVTLDSSLDQSSPKLYALNGNERIRDLTCGECYTVLLKNSNDLIYFGKEANIESVCLAAASTEEVKKRVELYTNVVSSLEFTLYNVGNFGDNYFGSFLRDEQKFVEEMLIVQQFLIKPLQKKSFVGFDELCQCYDNLLYFNASLLNSLQKFSNGLIPMNDIIMFKNIDEFILIYRNYVATVLNVISTDGFQNISKSMELSINLYKYRQDTFQNKNDNYNVTTTYLQAPLNRIPKYTTTYQNLSQDSATLMKWNNFILEFNEKKTSAEKTQQFWRNAGKSIDSLKSSERRLIRDSHTHPIHLANASRFSSHYFVLFSDMFVHVAGSTTHTHHLATLWIEAQSHDVHQHQIQLRMPEDVLLLYTGAAEMKVDWLHTLQGAVKAVLNKNGDGMAAPPAVRSGVHVFRGGGFFKEATYNGRWLNGKMHGKGRLEWTDGRVYVGTFSNNLISGGGVMEVPNVGVYEGQWKDNQQNGLGVFTYTNTDVYKGYFKDGVPHGHGFLRKGNFMANAASFYIGDWFNGLKNGYGVMDDISNGEKYLGNWLDNKRHGHGLIITSDGTFYEGNFNQDILTGHGMMILEDGTRYEGEFRGTGILSGKGTLRLTSGHTIEGTLAGSWDEGIKISNGTFIRSRDINNQSNGVKDLSAQKWKALFKQCQQVVLGIPDGIKNGARALDTQRIWQNVAVYLSNSSSSLKRWKGAAHALDQLDFIPPYGREKVDIETYLEVRNYLSKAFESNCHPIGSLLNDLSEAYNASYGGSAHPLLLTHAISELHYICQRLYEIVRFLFPALPPHDQEYLVGENQNEEIINYQSLLYPLILPKVHHPLFTLFTLKNELKERKYKRTLMEWNKMGDIELMVFLAVDVKFHSLPEPLFVMAIETLQQLKSTFSPSEKLLVIRQTVEQMTPVAQQLLGGNYVWNMDDLFPIFLFVVVRARIPDLGSELDFVDNFLDPSLESGELGIMYTTLKASYQQILQDKVANY